MAVNVAATHEVFLFDDLPIYIIEKENSERTRTCRTIRQGNSQSFLFPVLIFDADLDRISRVRKKRHKNIERRRRLAAAKTYEKKSCVVDEIIDIQKVIPRRRNVLLDRDFPSFVARDSRLQAISFELFEIGMTRVGDVVQMTREDILLNTSASEKVVDRLEGFLKNVGLGFGMTALGWRPGRSGPGPNHGR